MSDRRIGMNMARRILFLALRRRLPNFGKIRQYICVHRDLAFIKSRHLNVTSGCISDKHPILVNNSNTGKPLIIKQSKCLRCLGSIDDAHHVLLIGKAGLVERLCKILARNILGQILHQRRLADDVDALARLLVNNRHTVTMLLHKRSTEIGKGARFRYRHKGIASGQVRDGHVVRADVDELFLLVSNLELRESLDHLGGKVIGGFGLLTRSDDRADGIALVEKSDVLLLVIVPYRSAENVVLPKRLGGIDGLRLGRQLDHAMIRGGTTRLEIGGGSVG
mmetsp:Transcript_3328/g.5745  ORF Transcript_3328/g.5745 Transcript_3328/m.5745 type:complete len:279 (-) Transcript_3328:320-1156(-)